MREALHTFRHAILFLIALLVALPARPQDRPPAMSESDVMQLLKIQMPDDQIIGGIKKLGINFEMTAERERRFRPAGADDDVIAALRSVSKSSGETTQTGSAGGLEIHTQPGEAQVYLNDELKGMSSPEGRLRISRLAPGSYVVRVSLPGYESWQRSVMVTAGETASVLAPLAQNSTTTGTGGTPSVTPPSATSSNPSAIPLPDVRVDGVKFFESGSTMPDKRDYQTVFSGSTSRDIYWELDLSWGKIPARVNFDIDAVWHDPSGKLIYRNTHPAHVEPEWGGGSTHPDYYGCNTAPCNVWSIPGTYTVELYVKGAKVASGAFQIAASPSIGSPGVTTNSKTFFIGAVPLPDVSLYSLQTFESGRGTPDEDKRVYQTVFSKDSARYINWELHLKYGAISARADWDTNTSWYGPDGIVFARTATHARAMQDWNGGVVYLDGWGCDTAPCSAWSKPGTYKVELYVRGAKVASTSFQIQ
jgi:PEGA domain-containing protein